MHPLDPAQQAILDQREAAVTLDVNGDGKLSRREQFDFLREAIFMQARKHNVQVSDFNGENKPVAALTESVLPSVSADEVADTFVHSAHLIAKMATLTPEKWLQIQTEKCGDFLPKGIEKLTEYQVATLKRLMYNEFGIKPIVEIAPNLSAHSLHRAPAPKTRE